MENQIGPNEGRKAPRTALWVSLAVAALIVIAAALYFAGVFDTNTNSNTNAAANTNSANNTNAVANANSAVNQNTNSGANTNTETNTNSSTNVNSSVDTSDWTTYKNANYGYSFQYPSALETVDLTAENTSGISSKIGVRPTTTESELVFYVQVYEPEITSSSVIDAIKERWNVTDSDVQSDDDVATGGQRITIKPTELEGGREWHIFQLSGRVYEISFPIPHSTAPSIPNILKTFSLT